jgi:hypothetical protein
MSTTIDDVILQRISFLQEQICPLNRPAVNKTFQLQIDMLKSTDLQRLDRIIEWKRKEVKGCVDAHESERLFTELDALEWLQRQVKRHE